MIQPILNRREWTAQPIIDACPHKEAPRFLIRDREMYLRRLLHEACRGSRNRSGPDGSTLGVLSENCPKTCGKRWYFM